MKVRKYVELAEEVEVNISADDIRAALAEAFEVVTRDRLGEEGPNRNDVLMALGYIATFFNALTAEQIDTMTLAQRSTVWVYLLKSAERFEPPSERKTDGASPTPEAGDQAPPRVPRRKICES